MKSQLSDRDIVALHRMAKDGCRHCDIASRFRIHVATVADHLAMHVAYTEDIYNKIGKTPRLPECEPVLISEVAILLPGWPSRDKCYRLHKAGILKARPTRQSPGAPLVSSFAQVREAALKMMPEGVYLSTPTAQALMPPEPYDEAMQYSIFNNYWPRNRDRFIPLPVAESLYPIKLTAAAIHRICRVVEIVSVATI